MWLIYFHISLWNWVAWTCSRVTLTCVTVCKFMQDQYFQFATSEHYYFTVQNTYGNYIYSTKTLPFIITALSWCLWELCGIIILWQNGQQNWFIDFWKIKSKTALINIFFYIISGVGTAYRPTASVLKGQVHCQVFRYPS